MKTEKLEDLRERLLAKAAEFHGWSPLGELLREAAKALEEVQQGEKVRALERGY